MEALIDQIVEAVTPAIWEKLTNHVETKVEDAYWIADILHEQIAKKVIISVCGGADDDSDSTSNSNSDSIASSHSEDSDVDG